MVGSEGNLKGTNSCKQSVLALCGAAPQCLRGRSIRYIPAAATIAKEATGQVKDKPNLGCPDKVM